MNMSKEKPILLNGFPRSGTTFLFLKMYEHYDVAFYEPLHPSVGGFVTSYRKGKFYEKLHDYFSSKENKYIAEGYYRVFGDKIYDILKYHPAKFENDIVFPLEELKKYMSFFKGYPVKDVRLHFYLFEDFIKDNWEVYHIIRDPFGVYYSIKNRILRRIDKIPFKRFSIVNIIINKLGLNTIYNFARRSAFFYVSSNVKLYKIEAMSIEEVVLIGWIVTNHYVVSRLPKDRLLIYNKPDTLKNLPFDTEGFKPKILDDVKEKYQYIFERIAKEWELSEEYEELMKLFD